MSASETGFFSVVRVRRFSSGVELPSHHACLCGTGPPKQKRAPAKSALRKLRLVAAYRVLLLAQPRRAHRQCVACNSRVTNRNLGGHDGHGALSGPVWCYACADYARQLVFSFGGV
jgi:hypothetical protein